MQILSPDALVAALSWRYATKKFDAQRKIPDPTWAALERSLVLTPSSFGLQPWQFLVVTDPAIRERLVGASWGQRQVADCSHHVVFAIKKGLTVADVDRYAERILEVRGLHPPAIAGYRKMMTDFVARAPEVFDVDDWSARQVYLAVGQFMLAAAVVGVDTCPMEGIVPTQYDEILGLEKTGHATVCACSAGYRAADDRFATIPKVRYPDDDVVTHV